MLSRILWFRDLIFSKQIHILRLKLSRTTKTGKRSINVLGRKWPISYIPPRNPIKSTIVANSRTFKFSEPIDSAVLLGPVSSRWADSLSNTQMPHLSSLSDTKGSPPIDKSYLLRLPCTKPIVMVQMSPINSIADLGTHLHVIHATVRHLFSHHTTRSSQTDNLKEDFLTKM